MKLVSESLSYFGALVTFPFAMSMAFLARFALLLGYQASVFLIFFFLFVYFFIVFLFLIAFDLSLPVSVCVCVAAAAAAAVGKL